MKTIILDAARMTLRGETHAYLKEMLSFPEYYGENLDALFDCLTDLGPTEIVFVNQEQASEYFELVQKVFLTAAKHNEDLTISLSMD